MAQITIYRRSDYFVINDGKMYWVPVSNVGFREDSIDTITINYSPSQVSQKSWTGNVANVLSDHGTPHGTTAEKTMIELNSGLDVNVQDQHTQPVDTYFLQSISNFTVAVDVIPSTVNVLNYAFTATVGHGIIIGSKILILDIALDQEFYANVVNVQTNLITLDRPIDVAYTTNSIGRIVTNEMNVDGSVTPEIFTIRGGAVPYDITRLFVSFLSDSSMDDGKFGNLPPLTRGLVLRVLDGFQKTVFCFKTNGDIKRFCYDLQYATKAPSGLFGSTARISFAGQDKHGITFRLTGSDVLQWIVQDDLTGLTSLKATAQGHKIDE